MLKVGITGGIGSGKSTISAVFVYLGVPCYNADTRSKWISNNHKEVVKEIESEFGKQAYINGEMNRPYIASIVFSNKEKLAVLNQIIHPRVAEDYQLFCEKHKDAPYTLKEAAIMFESGTNKTMDKVILVVADKETRIKRVMQRDAISRNEVISRMDKQMSDEEKLKLADFVIDNNGVELIIPQVLAIHAQLKELKS